MARSLRTMTSWRISNLRPTTWMVYGLCPFGVLPPFLVGSVTTNQGARSRRRDVDNKHRNTAPHFYTKQRLLKLEMWYPTKSLQRCLPVRDHLHLLPARSLYQAPQQRLCSLASRSSSDLQIRLHHCRDGCVHTSTFDVANCH